MSELSDRWREFLVAPSGWKVYLEWSFLWQMEDNTRRSPLISKHGNYSSAVITLRHHFLSEWQVMVLGCYRERIFPCCTEHVYTRFSLAVLNLSTFCIRFWWREKWIIESIHVENIASTKGLKGKDVFINFINISFAVCLDSWSFYALLLETHKTLLGWH